MHHSTTFRSSFKDLQDLSHLTAVARVKVVRESRKGDHDLRHWVGHANFLDHLTRPTTLAATQQKVFQYAYAAAADKSSQPSVEIIEVEGDTPQSNKPVSKPKRPPPAPPKMSVVHCEIVDDNDEENDLAMMTRTVSHHGAVKVV